MQLAETSAYSKKDTLKKHNMLFNNIKNSLSIFQNAALFYV